MRVCCHWSRSGYDALKFGAFLPIVLWYLRLPVLTRVTIRDSRYDALAHSYTRSKSATSGRAAYRTKAIWWLPNWSAVGGDRVHIRGECLIILSLLAVCVGEHKWWTWRDPEPASRLKNVGIMCDVCVDFHDLLLSCKQRSIVYTHTVACSFLNLYHASHAAEFLSGEHIVMRNSVGTMWDTLRIFRSFLKRKSRAGDL